MNELRFDPNRRSLARLAPPQPVGILQRQCACGQHTLIGDTCESCHQEQPGLRRAGSSVTPLGDALPTVHKALALPGQLFDRHTRDFMETRFAHDFSQVQLSMDAQPYLGAQLFPTSPDDRSEREAERFAGAMSQTQSGRSFPSPMLRQSSGPHSRCDFGQVRVHTDILAAQSAQALGAEAYTVGRDIVFGAERYAPTTETGRRLLAHELTHFIQQAQTRQPRLQLTRLRDWQANRAAAVSDADIRGTTEYQSYMNPALIWQTRHHMTDAEAVQACRYMLAALRNGVAVDWSSDAQTYMTRGSNLPPKDGDFGGRATSLAGRRSQGCRQDHRWANPPCGTGRWLWRWANSLVEWPIGSRTESLAGECRDGHQPRGRQRTRNTTGIRGLSPRYCRQSQRMRVEPCLRLLFVRG